MDKLNLIIVDKDEFYLEYLFNFLERYKDKLNIRCFSNEDKFLEFMKSVDYKYVLLINNEIYERNEEVIDSEIILKLVDGSDDISESGIDKIYKYRDINSIYDKVAKAYSDCSYKRKATKIITVYSPVGGTGKSTISASLSSRLAKNDKSVLYLNLEDIQSTEMYFSGNNYISLSDVIKLVKQRDDKFKEILKENIDEKSSVKYFNSTNEFLDIELLDEEDAKWLLDKLVKLKRYDYVVVDTSAKYNSVYKSILEVSDIIIYPVVNNTSCISKVKMFLKNGCDIKKYYFVENMKYSDLKLEVPVSTSIIEDKSLAMLSSYQAITSNAITKYIDEIIGKLSL